MKNFNWCVIGAGGIADRRTIPGLLLDDGSKLVAVMDKSPAIAEAVGKKYGVPYFSDEKEMLETVDCDAVYISTPVMCHYEQAMLALEYGRHVLLEKPVASSSEDSEKLVSAFKKAGKQLSIGYMMKQHNLHAKAKEIISADGIGQIVNVRAQFCCWYPDIPGAWRQIKALGGGGAMMDLGVHCLELIEYVMGEEITEVKSLFSTLTFSYEVEDSAIVVFRTASGALGHVDVNFNIPDPASESKLEFYGTKGYVICKGTLAQAEVGTLSHLYAPQADYEAAQNRTVPTPVEYLGEEGNLYTKQIKAFREQVQSGQLDYFYADRAVQIQKLVDMIYGEN